MNASDTRNKKIIESMIGDLSKNNTLDYYSKNKPKVRDSLFNTNKKSVIIMDEVDGCGSGDRGGIGALINVIKNSKTPIICICNDRDNRKMQSLINHCYEIKFARPSASQVVSRIKQIANAEGLDIDEKAIELLITQSGSDIRQVIMQIQVAASSNKKITYKDMLNTMDATGKDQKLMINNFDAARKLMIAEEYSSMTYRDKVDLFFIDYDFIPLLVQENYLYAMNSNFSGSVKDVESMANAAAFIAFGDQVNTQVRSQQDWTLLSDLAFASAIAPCYYNKGSISYPKFPEWLGKNSSGLRAKRLINELKVSMGHRANCNKKTLLNEYLPLIFDAILKRQQKDDVEGAIAVLDSLNISNDQFKEHIATLIYDKKRLDALNGISTKAKTSFTKAYNTTHRTSLVAKKKKKEKGRNVEKDQFDPDKEEYADEEEDEDSEEYEIDIQAVGKAKGKPKKGKDEEVKAKSKPKTKAKTKKKK
jgi:replication factor C subunit 1